MRWVNRGLAVYLTVVGGYLVAATTEQGVPYPWVRFTVAVAALLLAVLALTNERAVDAENR